MAESRTGMVENRTAINPKDYTKTRCPDCGRQDKIEATEKVGKKCFQYQCNACKRTKGRKYPLFCTWVDETKRAPQYVLDEFKPEDSDE